ncbi:MAG: acyl-CoA dehydrogenase family protein, partial [Bryobacteraceae bacterium]
QRFGTKMDQEQEVLSYLADIVIDTFASESAVLRAQDASARGLARVDHHLDAARVFVNEAAGRVEVAARNCLAAMAEGDMLRTQLAALRRLLKVTPVNAVAMRRRLADATVSKGGYLFG